MATPEPPPPEPLQPCRLPVPSHPSCPCAALRAGGRPAVSSAGQPPARGVRADPRRGQQRAGWQQGWQGVGGRGRGKRPFDFPIPASKHGVVGLTKTAALEYATSGIRVNCICPGYIRTPLLESLLTNQPEMEAQIVARHPVGRMGQPEEIAEAVVWLCSDAASFVTGHTMTVDGGYVAQ